MFGLGLVSNLLGGGGQTKEEKKELAKNATEVKDQRDRDERELDERKRAYAADGGGDANGGKENKSKVCSCMDPLGIFSVAK